jgi:hypothetical protein
LAGIYLIISNYVELDNPILLYCAPIKPYGPHITPIFFTKPLRIYTPNLNRNQIGIENRKHTIIYQWLNLINGKIYIGSG